MCTFIFLCQGYSKDEIGEKINISRYRRCVLKKKTFESAFKAPLLNNAHMESTLCNSKHFFLLLITVSEFHTPLLTTPKVWHREEESSSRKDTGKVKKQMK